MSRFGHLEFEESPRKRENGVRPVGASQPTAESYFLSAIEEHHWGRFEQALRTYTRCLEENRAMIPAWIGQVQMLVQLNELPEARLWADKALELFHNNGELLAAKAQACIRQNDTRAAYACSDLSLKSPGASPYRWQVRGETLMASGKQMHEECFKRSFLEPQANWFDRVAVADVCLFHSKPAAAAEYASQATQLQPDAGYAWFVLGNAQCCMGMNHVAIQSYQRCLDLRPDYREAQEAIVEASREPLIRRIFRHFFH